MKKIFSLVLALSLTFTSLLYANAEVGPGVSTNEGALIFAKAYGSVLKEKVSVKSPDAVALASTATEFPTYASYRENARDGKNGWQLDSKNMWQYQKENGALAVNEWVMVGNKWYAFDEAGQMRTGWYKEPSTGYVYFFDTTDNLGNAVNDIQNIDGYYYYFGNDGRMKTDLDLGNGISLGSDGKISVNGILQVTGETSLVSAQNVTFSSATTKKESPKTASSASSGRSGNSGNDGGGSSAPASDDDGGGSSAPEGNDDGGGSSNPPAGGGDEDDPTQAPDPLPYPDEPLQLPTTCTYDENTDEFIAFTAAGNAISQAIGANNNFDIKFEVEVNLDDADYSSWVDLVSGETVNCKVGMNGNALTFATNGDGFIFPESDGWFFLFFDLFNLSPLDGKNVNTIYLKNLHFHEGTTEMKHFLNTSNVSCVDFNYFDTSEIEDVDSAFKGCSGLTSVKGKFISSLCEYTEDMFANCTSLESLDISLCDTQSIGTFTHAFGGCTSLKHIDMTNNNLESCDGCGSMFEGCTELETVEMKFAQLEDASEMFKDCSSLTSIKFEFTGDGITGDASWFDDMFLNADNLTTVTMTADAFAFFNQLLGWGTAYSTEDLGNGLIKHTKNTNSSFNLDDDSIISQELELESSSNEESEEDESTAETEDGTGVEETEEASFPENIISMNETEDESEEETEEELQSETNEIEPEEE